MNIFYLMHIIFFHAFSFYIGNLVLVNLLTLKRDQTCKTAPAIEAGNIVLCKVRRSLQ